MTWRGQKRLFADAAPARFKLYAWRREFNFSHREALVGLVAQKAEVTRAEVFLVMSDLRSAANKAQPRGYVSDWDTAEAAFALQMHEAVIVRVVDALYELHWLDQQAIVDWTLTQPEDEDPTAAERQRRRRAKLKLQREGGTYPPSRAVTRDSRFSTGLGTTGDAQQRPPDSQELAAPPNVTRDSVTVTADQIRPDELPAVDNSGGSASGIAASQQEEEIHAEAELWLMSAGKRLLIDNLQINPTLAETWIERWRRDLDDDAKLVDMMRGAEATGYIGARFHTLITDQVRRRRVLAAKGPELPLISPVPGRRSGSG